MTRSFLVLAATVMLSASANASINDFCQPHAIDAAVKLAGLNGSVSETVTDVTSVGTSSYEISLSEAGLGKDRYRVVTSGGHECLILSITVLNVPTLRP